MTYVPRLKPYAHQKKALEKMTGKRAFALLLAMRCGKTKVLLDDFGHLENARKIDDLMVIAPAGVYRTWEKAVVDHVGEELLPRLAVHTWSAGAGKRENAVLNAFLAERSKPRILLLNVEALSSVERAKALAKVFLGQRRAMLAIDESCVIKSPTAQRTKFIVRELAPLAIYRRILSGLPTPRSPLDLYTQFQFLDPKILGFSSYFSFRARYAILKSIPLQNRNVAIVVGYRDVEELSEKIAPHSHRVLLEDCYDMPPAIYMRRDVELTQEQKSLYQQMKLFATAQLNQTSHVTATQVITQILRLHQILCGHTSDENGKVHQIPEKRTAALLEQLEECEGKAIIWCSYDADIQKVTEALSKEYGKNSVARFWGGNRATREDEEKTFLSDKDCRFMVATPAAGGRGRTWSNANLVIFYSNVNDLEQRAQAEERVKGVDKKVPIAYVDLVVPGTVDEKIIKALRNKINMATSITNDGYKEWLI